MHTCSAVPWYRCISHSVRDVVVLVLTNDTSDALDKLATELDDVSDDDIREARVRMYCRTYSTVGSSEIFPRAVEISNVRVPQILEAVEIQILF